MSQDPYSKSGFTRESLLEAIKLGEGQFTKRELARALSLKGDQRIALKQALRELENSGMIRKTGGKAYALGDELPSVTVLQITDRDIDGELLCEPVKSDQKGPLIRLAPGEGKAQKGEAAIGMGDRILGRLKREDDGSYEAPPDQAAGTIGSQGSVCLSGEW